MLRAAIVLRWLRTIAAEPILTGVTAQPVTSPDTDHDGGHRDEPPKHRNVPSYDPGKSASTDRMTSPHQVSSSVSRSG